MQRETLADELRRAEAQAIAKSREYPDRPVSVYFVRRGPLAHHSRWNTYHGVAVRFDDMRSPFEADGYVYVIHRGWVNGEEIPC